MDSKAWNAWVDAEEARRRLEEDPPDNTGLLAADEFDDEYNSTTEGGRGSSKTIAGLLAGACAGWARQPNAAGFQEAMRASKPSRRQRSIIAVLISEATLDEVLMAHREGAFTWRQLSERMHQRGRYSGKLARYVNMRRSRR